MEKYQFLNMLKATSRQRVTLLSGVILCACLVILGLRAITIDGESHQWESIQGFAGFHGTIASTDRWWVPDLASDLIFVP